MGLESVSASEDVIGDLDEVKQMETTLPEKANAYVLPLQYVNQ